MLDKILKEFKDNDIVVYHGHLENVNNKPTIAFYGEENVVSFIELIKLNDVKYIISTEARVDESLLIELDEITESEYGQAYRKIRNKVKKYNDEVKSRFGELILVRFVAISKEIAFRLVIHNEESTKYCDDPEEVLLRFEDEHSDEIFRYKQEIDNQEEQVLRKQKREKEKVLESKLISDDILWQLANKESRIYRGIQIANDESYEISKVDMGALLDMLLVKMKKR